MNGLDLHVVVDVLVDFRDVVNGLLRVILQRIFDIDKGLVGGFELLDEELERLVKCFLLLLLQILLSCAGLHFRIRDGHELFIRDRSQVSLVKVVVTVLKERRSFGRVLRVVLDDEATRVEILLAVKLSLLVNIGEAFILLLDASELNATSLRPSSEDRLGIRESDHEAI